MLDRKVLDELYSLYGFEKGEERENFSVYLHSEGYFHNAEIVQFKTNEIELSQVRDQYSELGFSVHVSLFDKIEATHASLFAGFFNIKHSNNRLIQEYNNFCELQTKKTLGNYSYVEGRFFINGQLSESGLIEQISSKISESGPQLIILEAAAGFGKTCTSYEVIHRLASNSIDKVPLLAELSKNRKASVFRYVLLSEIDRKFTTLSSSLVTYEIKNGRVPLIIDGFDELLSKSNSLTELNSKDAEEAQTMLDTIADLLTYNSKAKILLTSRKSSIFTGDIFDDWAEKKLFNCNITRIQLAEPTAQDWVGYEKFVVLKELGISLDNILNPVLLTFIRNQTIETIRQNYGNNENILDQYFSLLLTREQERQQLLLDIREQISIMQQLASYLVQFDISSEEPQFIRELLLDILTGNLNKYLERYSDSLLQSSEDRPTDEEFVMKLVHHALLDRVSANSNKIGFINDFILGLFIGDALIFNKLSIDQMSEKYIDIASTSYGIKDEQSRKTLFKKITPVIVQLSVEYQLLIDINLVKKLTQNYCDQYFDSLVFKSNFYFDTRYKFINCIFSSCSFDNCTIPTSVFQSCQFYNCQFYNVNIINNSSNDAELIFSGCSGHDEFIIASSTRFDSLLIDTEQNYEKFVLEQYWKVGYDMAEPRRSYRTLFRGTSSEERGFVNDAIETLIDRSILRKTSTYIELNFTRMSEIRDILGR